MIAAKQMGYATFETPDLERAVAYYTGYLGLTEVARDGGTVFLACPSDLYSVAVRQGSAAAVTRLALQLASDADLDTCERELKGKGAVVRRGTDIGPHTPATLTVTDPSGMDVDLIAAYAVEDNRAPNRGVTPRKLGHAAFFTPDIDATVRFYTQLLGFRVSDWIGDFFVFLRCNPDHHTVNFLSGPGRGLHHIAFELNDWDHVKQACDLLYDHDLDLIWGPGRHGPGHNIFTYHLNPDGFTVELFTELDTMSNEENGYFDPRSWHRDRPQRPKVWDPASIRSRNFWGLSKPDQPKDVGKYR